MSGHDDRERERLPRIVHHAPLRRWSPLSQQERREMRAFVRRLTEFPYLTLGVVALLLWAYAIQVVLGWPLTLLLPPSAPGDALVSEALGAKLGWLDASAVRAGEGWRLLSATLLHGSVLHVAGNCAVLFLLGRVVENVYGRAAFLVGYVGAGAAGTALSVLLSGNNSLGASGAILGMLGMSLALGLRHKADIPGPLRDYFRTDMWVFVLLVGAMSLLPFVDWAGHLGGLLWGLGLGLLWPPEMLVAPGRRARMLGGALAGAAVGSILFCAIVVGQRVARAEGPLPREELRAFVAAWDRDDRPALVRIASRMSAGYPDSPRMQMELGRVFLVVGEYQLAVDAFRRFERLGDDREPDLRWQNDVAWAMFLASPDDPASVDDGLGRVRRALAEDPSDPAMRNTLAYGLLLDGDFARAERITRELMDAKETHEERVVDAWIHVAALAALGRGEEARAERDVFARITPDEPGLEMGDIVQIRSRTEADLRRRGLLGTNDAAAGSPEATPAPGPQPPDAP